MESIFDIEYKKLIDYLDKINITDSKGYKLAQELKEHIIKNYQNCLLMKDYTQPEAIDSVNWTNTEYLIVNTNKKHTLKDVIDYLVNLKDIDHFNGVFKNYHIDVYNGKIIEYKGEKLPDNIFNEQIERITIHSALGNTPEKTITFFKKGNK